LAQQFTGSIWNEAKSGIAKQNRNQTLKLKTISLIFLFLDLRMNFQRGFYHFLSRGKFRLQLLLTLCAAIFASQTSFAQAPISNGSAQELAAVQKNLDWLERAVTSRDANALRFYGARAATADAIIRAQLRATNIAFSPAGALVRQTFHIQSFNDSGAALSTPVTGTMEFWLTRGADNKFSFTEKRWSAPEDAVALLQSAAREEWNTSKGAQLLDVIAMRRGGRWIALRTSRWNGTILDDQSLVPVTRAQTVVRGDAFDANWLRAQMQSAPDDAPGTGHFLLQKTATGWIGLGMAWDADRKLSANSNTITGNARRDILGANYALPSAHQKFGIALALVGLYQEAGDELEKADALQPGIVDESLLQKVRDARKNDPQNSALEQLKNEAGVGLDPGHPFYETKKLMQDFQNSPSVLLALRLGLEYSRLGDDALAAQQLQVAADLVERGAMQNVSAADAQWIQVISEHLQERRDLASIKPPNIITSSLFSLRCRPNDLAAIQVLAALEAAQHTVYADFNIPMGSTEVLLWRTQREFQQYVTKFSSQGNSEFVAALTLTKLIATRVGPKVLGEEINVFTDAQTGVFSTVAHEYGHVAVRQLSQGRDVPTWFNEGIATSVEGGYDGYVERVQNASRNGTLLSMREMQQWNVDGERAFLAYSQANSLVDYIVAKWGKASILTILRRIGSDESPDEAFRAVLGMSQQTLWNQWARDGIG
jgi:tetratricopeptide (TPR) repeat protein